MIITGRGGGSLEDLWAFNEEYVARAIYESKIPIISAVGHEPDVTISDLVADRRASTPSNAAEIAVPDQKEIRALLESLSARINQAFGQQLDHKRQILKPFQSGKALSDVSYFVDLRRMEIDRLGDRMDHSLNSALTEKRAVLSTNTASLHALSPLKVLSRGYLIAENKNQQVLRSIEQVFEGSRLTLRFADGKAECLVENREVYEDGI